MMSNFWRNWLTVWCWAVALFGLVLAAGGFAATSAPAALAMSLLHSGPAPVFDEPLRFAVGLMGALTLGLAMLVAAAMRGADALGEGAGPVWSAITNALLVWYVVDSSISCANGFVLNAVSNTGIIVMFLVPMLASGVLKKA
ncbi:hypothetical protein [Sandarakinorhabdus sp.]|uniref:hypothetical protein n=1 Tax=Sandarakinorhabdus sp. TaxID=1916663 RepID=UPI00286DD688|nr:hypothetical protein [Sandarakinorhabdus sp.]